MNRIPEDIAKHRPGTCTEIKPISGHYYVYTYRSVKLPSGKWGKKTDKCIGSIVEGVGFCPNKNYQGSDDNRITVLEYGQYAFIEKIADSVR